MTGFLQLANTLSTGLAWSALVLVGFQASAQIKVLPTRANVQQGTSRTFTAERSDHQPAEWQWSIETGPPGGVIDPKTGAYQAPAQVAAGSSRALQLRVTDLARPGTSVLVAGMVTAALGDIHCPDVVQAGKDNELILSATRRDDSAPTWSWWVTGLPGAEIVTKDVRTMVRLPRVLEATSITVHAADTANPGDELVKEVVVLPSMVALKVTAWELRPLRSGRTCTLQATRADGKELRWSWEVLEPGGGTLEPQEKGGALYIAPQVRIPTTFHIQVTSHLDDDDLLDHYATLAVEVRPTIQVLRPGVGDSPGNSPHVLSGNDCVLRAITNRPGASAPISWSWKVLHADRLPDLQLTPSPGSEEVRFRAPDVGWPTVYQIEVKDDQAPADPARFKVQVLPALPGLQRHTAVFEQLMPAIMGSDWLAPPPMATLLAGRLGPPKPGRPAKFQGINCITYVEADPAMGWLSEKWLVGDRTGIKVVNRRGEVTQLPGVYGSVTAIAIRPRGSAPASQDRVVFATQFASRTGHSLVSLLKGGRKPVILAGAWPQRLQFHQVDDGSGRRKRFHRILGLTWTPDGKVNAVDKAEENLGVFQISLDGTVTDLANTGEIDGPGVAFEPETGAIYLASDNLNTIAKVSAKGDLEILLEPADDTPTGHWSDLDNDRFTEDDPGGRRRKTPYLWNPSGLQLRGDYLFIADTGNDALRVWNLRTQKMLTLVWDPGEVTATRLGPLGYAVPSQSAAALLEPKVFHVNNAGDCLVVQGDALVHLDLSAFALETLDPMVDIEPEDDPMVDVAPAAASSAQPSRKRAAPADAADGQAARPQPPAPEGLGQPSIK